LAPETGKARVPMVERLNDGTASWSHNKVIIRTETETATPVFESEVNHLKLLCKKKRKTS